MVQRFIDQPAPSASVKLRGQKIIFKKTDALDGTGM
jgi:hypothetical protein